MLKGYKIFKRSQDLSGLQSDIISNGLASSPIQILLHSIVNLQS